MDAQTVHSVDEIVKNKFNPEQLKEYNRIHYGRTDHCELKIQDSTLAAGKEHGFEVAAFSFDAAKECIRAPKIVKVGLIQHSIVLPTNQPIDKQRAAIFDKVEKIIDAAAAEGVQILCLQEAWYMPFFLCTGEKKEWEQLVESAEDGPSFQFLSKLAKKYSMVIVSPILENDDEVWWNTAVVIDDDGTFLGKHRKNHLPSVGSFSETPYYSPGNTGHPVFVTKYAKFSVNICYGRHHVLNWLMFGINGAEIVFNPAATISEFGESFWGVEARNAAIANSYFTCGLNRVGTEDFSTKIDQKKVTRSYYGSSYVTAPNGCRTPGLSRNKDGLLIAQMDLNLCRQVKDHWGFQMTGRFDDYAKELNAVCSAQNLIR